jgi:GNAT superfamily N-acetyltransferase
MVDTEELAIAQLDDSYAAGGLALSTEAGWNQNEADWRFFLTKGIVFGVRDRKRQLVATAALLPYAGTDAWISMVLVTARHRRRGLATRLVDACLDTAIRLGVTACLDATPAGAAVYGPLGFQPTIELRRLRLENASSSRPATPIPAGKFDAFVTRDIAAMGFDRRELLCALVERPMSRLLANGDTMTLVRNGRTARHIGPLFADNPEHALEMVGHIVASESGQLLIDAVATQDMFIKGLIDSGWTVERPFQRMRFGGSTTRPDEPPFAVVGPEFG